MDELTLLIGASQKWTAATLQPPSGMDLKENEERKSPQQAELQAAHLNIYFVKKEKWPKVRMYICYLLLHYKLP